MTDQSDQAEAKAKVERGRRQVPNDDVVIAKEVTGEGWV